MLRALLILGAAFAMAACGGGQSVPSYATDASGVPITTQAPPQSNEPGWGGVAAAGALGYLLGNHNGRSSATAAPPSVVHNTTVIQQKKVVVVRPQPLPVTPTKPSYTPPPRPSYTPPPRPYVSRPSFSSSRSFSRGR